MPVCGKDGEERLELHAGTGNYARQGSLAARAQRERKLADNGDGIRANKSNKKTKKAR